MKKITVFLLFFLFIAVISSATDNRRNTPDVRYIEPVNDSLVDLVGKKYLTFRWKSTPKPSGGRAAYRFDLYNDFGYDVLVNKTFARDVYSIDIPVDRFENGAFYSWQVKQRGRTTRAWSRNYRWSFKVKK